jgi:hypothetical protein
MENIKEKVPAILEACKRIKESGGRGIETTSVTVRGIECTRIEWLEAAICDCCNLTFEDAIFINDPKVVGDCVDSDEEEEEVYNYWE